MFLAVEGHKWNGKRHLVKLGIIAGKWYHLRQSVVCGNIWNEALKDGLCEGRNGANLSKIKNLISLTDFHKPRASKFGGLKIIV